MVFAPRRGPIVWSCLRESGWQIAQIVGTILQLEQDHLYGLPRKRFRAFRLATVRFTPLLCNRGYRCVGLRKG